MLSINSVEHYRWPIELVSLLLLCTCRNIVQQTTSKYLVPAVRMHNKRVEKRTNIYWYQADSNSRTRSPYY